MDWRRVSTSIVLLGLERVLNFKTGVTLGT